MKSARGWDISAAKGAKIKIGKHLVRSEDQTRYTVPSLGERRERRRKKNKEARVSRRRHR